MSDMTPQQAADEFKRQRPQSAATEWGRVLIDHARAAAPEGEVADLFRHALYLLDTMVRAIDYGEVSDLDTTMIGATVDRLRVALPAPSVAAPPREDESPGTRLSRESIEMHRASRSPGTVHDPEREP